MIECYSHKPVTQGNIQSENRSDQIYYNPPLQEEL